MVAKNPSFAGDLAYQDASLQQVSRTFALTIPLLPEALSHVVGNAYLLCRIADTIEDTTSLSPEEKRRYGDEFVAVLEGSIPPEDFAARLSPRLCEGIIEAEQDLVRNTPRVLRLTHGFGQAEQDAMIRCVRIMARGMAEYQERDCAHGLPDMEHMQDYCYYVAGVVGEMLTDLFCAYSPAVAAQRDRLAPLAVPFGRGLQMTNILKDIWEDHQRGVCWLPRGEFEALGFDLDEMGQGESQNPAFESALGRLIGAALDDLDQAMSYSLIIPVSEPGIRQFCLWPVGMAVMTLRNINGHRDFRSGDEVKISRNSVMVTGFTTRLCARSNLLMRAIFRTGAIGMPHARP